MPGSTVAEEAPARPGLPLFLGVLLVAAWHGPLMRTGALLEEHSLLASPGGVHGWVPGVLFAKLELLALQAQAHRAVGLMLEVLLVVCATMVLRRQGTFMLAAVALPVVYVLHPAHTETSLLLSSRPLLVCEVLLVVGALGLGSSRTSTHRLACVALAAGDVGMPAALALALPFLCGSPSLRGTRRTWAVLALWAGFLVGVWGRSMQGATWQGLDGWPVWWQPGTLGLVLSTGTSGWIPAGAFLVMALVLRFLAPVASRRAVDLALVAVALTLLAGPAVRPQRLDLGRVGQELTPDVFLPFLAAALILFHVATRSAEGRRRLLPLLLLVVLAPGWLHASRFRDEGRLLEAAARSQPGSPSVHQAFAEYHLRQVLQVAEPLRYDTAREALAEANQAIRLGAGRRARSAQCLALAWLGKPGEARESWSRLVADQGRTAALLMLRGDLELALQDPWEALRWFREASDRADHRGPERRTAELLDQLHARIEASFRTSTPAETRSLCDQLLAAAPDDLRAWEARAATFLLEERFEDAADACQDILDFAPVSRVALRGMIQALEAMERADEAAIYRRRLLDLGGMREFQ